MPVLDGVDVIDEIRREDPSARIVILTTYDSDNDICRAIKAGAKGYLLKDARREELLDCIRKVSVRAVQAVRPRPEVFAVNNSLRCASKTEPKRHFYDTTSNVTAPRYWKSFQVSRLWLACFVSYRRGATPEVALFA